MENSPLFELADNLNSLMTKAHANIEQHIETNETEVLSFTEEYKKRVIQSKEQKDRLLIEIESANHRKLDLKQKLDEIHSRTIASQEAHEREQRLELLERRNQQLRTEHKQLELELQNRKKEQQEKEMLDAKLIEATMTQLQASIDLVQLELINTKDNGSIKVVMKHVNPQDPDQTFTLEHDLDEEQRYRLVQSDPLLPQAYLGPIFNELNDTRDYYAFLKKLRKLYQDTL